MVSYKNSSEFSFLFARPTPCGDSNSSAEAIDRSCPDTANGEMALVRCPVPCVAAFLPWWEGCGTTAALLDALPASVIDQRCAFYVSYGGEDMATNPMGPSKTPCSANVDCAAWGKNVDKFCAQVLDGRPQTCTDCVGRLGHRWRRVQDILQRR